MALTPLRVNPPLKGVNTTTPIREMSHEYAIRLDNVWTDKAGAIGRRPGQTSITTLNPAITGYDRLVEYKSQGGASILFLHEVFSGVIYRQTGPTLTVELESVGIPLVFSNLPSVIQMGGQMLMGDGIKTSVFDGTVWSNPSGVPAATINNNCSIFATHNGRGYGAGNLAHQSVVFFSAPSDNGANSSLGLMDWTISTTGAAGFIDTSAAVGVGEKVTGLATFQGLLIVFLQNHIVLYNAQDPATALSVYKVIPGMGCISHDSIQGAGNDLIFLSQYGFQRLKEVLVQGDAAAVASSIPINNYIIDQIASAPTSVPKIRSTYVEKLGVYLCKVDTITWAYHVIHGGWAPWYGIQDQLLTTADGTLYTATNTLHSVDSNNSTDLIDGAVPRAIDWLWETAPFRSNSQEHKARWNRVEVIYEALIGASFTVRSWINLDKTTQQSITTTLAPTNLITDFNGMKWQTTLLNANPRSKWGGVAGSVSKWAGVNKIGNSLLAGSEMVPVQGRAELFSVEVSNSDSSYLRISALEVYHNQGGLRDG